MVKCPGCGSGMRFDPVSQMVKCDYCETLLPPEDASPTLMVGEQVVFDSNMYTCPQCGAEIISDEDTVATFCSFCGASVMLESKAVKMMAPSYVLPFKITKENCVEQYKKLIKGSIFAPSYMKSEEQMNKLRGIYMPYWNYDFGKNGRVNYKGKKSYRRGDYIITDHYDLYADVQAGYKGLAFDASSSFADELSDAIAPFDVRANKNFSSSYLSGFYADTADVNASVYETEAKGIVAYDIGMELSKIPEFRKYNIDITSGNVSNNLITNNQEVSYFPVWFLANRSKGKVSYAVINGQTGKIAADIPIDYKKYILGSLILALPIILLLNFLFTLTPTFMMFIAIVFAVISLIISNNQLDLLHTRQFYLNDKGLQSTRGVNPEAYQQNKTKPAKKNNSLLWVVIAFFVMPTVLPFLMVLTGASEETIGMLVFVFMALFMIVLFCIGKGNGGASKSSVTIKKLVYKKPLKEKMNVLIKPIIAIVLGALIMLWNPAMDYWYYGGIFITMILVLISFWDLVSVHNQLTMRMPRQFGKRGGDENVGF